MSATDHATGLTPQQVEESRSLHGRNILTPAAREPLWKKFLHKFSDPLIIILLVAGALSVSIAVYEHMVLGEGAGVFFEPAGIFMAILLATGLGFYFEVKADREFAILNKVNDDEPVRVVRDGNTVEIPKSEIVVGDVVMVNTGDEVPADGKLLKSVALSVDESSLTGEPVARKTTEKEHFDPDATFPSDMLLRGSKVMEGYGVMCVTRVGDATEIGKVHEAAMIDDSVKTPLNEQLERLGRLISIGSYVIAAIIMAGRILMYLTQPGFTFEWVGFLTYMLQTVMIAVTLIVVAVPEGLPMAVTLSLAYSMRRMLKTNNLVRKMHACETMGAATVICTDKTGTLTQNKMQVTETFFPDIDNEVVRHDVEEGVAVNSTATLDLSDPATPKALGNPTEGALLLWLHGSGRDYMRMREETEIADQLPFTTENKYMATLVRQADGSGILYLKGAPEIVYSMCDDNGGIGKESLDSRLLDWQNRAMRTLGFAVARTAPGQTVFADGKVCTGGLRFLGITAIMDPVREDVPQAVDEVLHAGIKIKIVTGDTPGTAKEIGRRIGLWDDATDSERNIITGTEFEALGDDELKERVEDLKIIARARPMDKKRLVESLQGLGEVVAVTGDGTNDAPALKSAHVGLSMGDGTSVAKDASDITIVDNSFSSIGRAVMWGRSLYRNIQRFILFQLTVNVVACLIVMSGAFMG
ncbi:MAG: calcium-translocating P-type ATPase, PMCA-type, partial [Muribaculaceae bacterium]|nr:calcium-translocating P-type ATPase, PMCA-type [Muribaculaceae bacterium]